MTAQAVPGAPAGEGDRATIRVVLPPPLRLLAKIETGEIQVQVDGPPTQRAVLDAVEARYPMLLGTIRDHATKERRAYLRFFACREDLSLEPPDSLLPEAVAAGREAFFVVGAIAGG